jgi:hypothetical protein
MGASPAVWWTTGTIGIISFVIVLALLIVIQSRLNERYLRIRRQQDQLRFLIWVCVLFTIVWLISFGTMVIYVGTTPGVAGPPKGVETPAPPLSGILKESKTPQSPANTLIRLQRAFEADDYSNIADIIDKMPSLEADEVCKFRSYTTTPTSSRGGVKSVSWADIFS